MKRKLNARGKILVGAVSMIAICAIAASAAFYEPKLEYTEKSIEVPQGAGTSRVADILEREGIISNKLKFKLTAKLKGYDTKLKFGNFDLSSDMTDTELLEALSSSINSSRGSMITIPEGYTIKQIGQKLEEAGIINKNDFYEACKNEKFNYDFLDGAKGDNYLEGFLFPDTYEFEKGQDARSIIEKMLERFNKEFKESDLKKARSLGYNYNEVITVASIIEREVRKPQERAMVAGVIYNRLEKGQKLQMCSTIQYILGEQHDKLYEKDLEIDSPYNTYKNVGLPAGPISNPGHESIKAALNPVEHNYYFFVLKDEQTGEHQFSTTYDEHVRAKQKYIK